MSLPRRLVPGRTYATTRRVARRCFLLRPDRDVNAIVLYALGLAVTRHGIDLHAFLAESNHHHGVATDDPDVSGLPGFFRELDGLVARALNAHYGRGENLWATGSYGSVEIHDKATLEDQLLYLWTNPVKDGLVELPEHWPGVKFMPEDFGRTITAHRPEGAFFGGLRPSDYEPTYPPARAAHRRRARRDEVARRGGPDRSSRPPRPGARPAKRPAPRPERRDRRRLPPTVTFEITPPPGYEHMTLAEVRAHFRKLLDERLAQIHAERRAQGLTRFMGARAVLEQDPFESSGDTFPTFGRNPRLACVDRDRRPGLLAELQAWRVAYGVALTTWRSGDRNVSFPVGSYALPRFHGARVARATGPPSLA